MIYLIVMSESGTWIETLIGPFKGPASAGEYAKKHYSGHEYCISEPKLPVQS